MCDVLDPTVYSDEEIFTAIEMTYGAPPAPVPAGVAHDPRFAARSYDEAVYYNNITTLIGRMCKHEIVRQHKVRSAFFLRHGIMSFDYIERRT